MITLFSIGLFLFYLYSSFNIYALNHRSYINYVVLLLDICFTVASFANLMIFNSIDYEQVYMWVRIYQYAVLGIPMLFFLGVLYLVFPNLNKKRVTIIVAISMLLLLILESSSIGISSFGIYSKGEGFHWRFNTDSSSAVIYNVFYMIVFFPPIIIGLWWLSTYIKEAIKKFHKIINVFIILAGSVILFIIINYFLSVTNKVNDAVFFYIIIGIPISSIYVLIFQKRKLPLAILKNYSTEIFNNLSEGLVVLAEDFKVINSNFFAKQFFGWEKDKDYYFWDYNTAEIQKKRMKNENFLINQAGFVVDKNGNNVPISYTIAKIDDQEEKDKYLLIFMDVSKSKNMENQLIQANKELNNQIILRTKEIDKKNNDLLLEIDKKEDNQKQIEYFFENDYMTDLLNKNGFMNQMNQNQNREEQTLISINLLNMKIINETYGRVIAERAIIKIAQLLKKNWEDKGIIARFETYRFLIYCGYQASDELIEQVFQEFQKPITIDRLKIEIDCGIGVVHKRKNDSKQKNINQMIIESDLAANQAKKYGKNRYYNYSNQMVPKRGIEFSMLNDYIYAALTEKKLELRYNLKFNNQEQVAGIIVQIQWKMNEIQIISEDEIIKIAEKYNFSQELEIWRIQQLVSDIKELDKYYQTKFLPIKFRLMKSTFYNEIYLKQLLDIVDKSELNRQQFQISLGEEIFMEATDLLNMQIAKIRQCGIKVGLYNFGGMHSSLKFLRDLEIDFIVLSPEFVEGIGVNQRDEAILKMILDLSRNMNYSVLVENISCENQLNFLAKECHEFAGSYFFKPGSIKEISEKIQNMTKKA